MVLRLIRTEVFQDLAGMDLASGLRLIGHVDLAVDRSSLFPVPLDLSKEVRAPTFQKLEFGGPVALDVQGLPDERRAGLDVIRSWNELCVCQLEAELALLEFLGVQLMRQPPGPKVTQGTAVHVHDPGVNVLLHGLAQNCSPQISALQLRMYSSS